MKFYSYTNNNHNYTKAISLQMAKAKAQFDSVCTLNTMMASANSLIGQKQRKQEKCMKKF